MTDAIFPSASTTDAVILALSYCQARKLDPFKKPVQIVAMWDAKRKQMVDTVWPGIGELRTTAFRTGQYAGRDAAIFGELQTLQVGNMTLTFPAWCEIVVHRLLGGVRVPFHGPRVVWMETYATKSRDDSSPNAMWAKRPTGQLEKCAEAASLRAAFPEEMGNEYAAEEMEGKIIDLEAMGAPETVGVPKTINSSQAKKANIWPELEAQIRGFTDLAELEEWWETSETRTRVTALPGKWQDAAQNEFELAQERLAILIQEELHAVRANGADLPAQTEVEK